MLAFPVVHSLIHLVSFPLCSNRFAGALAMTARQLGRAGRDKRRRPQNWQGLAELLSVATGVILLQALAPLGTRAFGHLTPFVCSAAILYAIICLAAQPGTARRWGLPWISPAEPADCFRDPEEEVFGCLFLGRIMLVSAVPILLVKMVAPLPSVSDPLGYLFWCAVQDFLFFALVQKNLQERVPGPVAVLGTALLFGLSHYPYGIFMAGTALVSGLWGYVFLRTNSLVPVLLSHWTMGLILLG
jgi:membrane protease YdiL (CAAX protease family)